ncbi:MAG: DUF397 domain-containing protein [Pseudonocardiaceae bacterium]
MIDKAPLARAEWRKSSFSGDGDIGGGNCVEIAPLPDGRITLRNSNHPHAAVLLFTRTQTKAWLTACKSGALDDPTSPA